MTLMNVPGELRYSSDHEWIRVEGNRATIGITDYAQDALGDVVYVQLPSVGVSVSAGDSFSEVESTKSVSDIYAPITGEVVARNEGLDSAPETVNSDAYGAGWMVELRPADPAQLDGLLSAADYRALVEKA